MVKAGVNPQTLRHRTFYSAQTSISKSTGECCGAGMPRMTDGMLGGRRDGEYHNVCHGGETREHGWDDDRHDGR